MKDRIDVYTSKDSAGNQLILLAMPVDAAVEIVRCFEKVNHSNVLVGQKVKEAIDSAVSNFKYHGWVDKRRGNTPESVEEVEIEEVDIPKESLIDHYRRKSNQPTVKDTVHE